MVERLGRLSDLELWCDMRASKSEGAHRCRRARVSQPNASGLRLARRIFYGRLSNYILINLFFFLLQPALDIKLLCILHGSTHFCFTLTFVNKFFVFHFFIFQFFMITYWVGWYENNWPQRIS